MLTARLCSLAFGRGLMRCGKVQLPGRYVLQVLSCSRIGRAAKRVDRVGANGRGRPGDPVAGGEVEKGFGAPANRVDGNWARSGLGVRGLLAR